MIDGSRAEELVELRIGEGFGPFLAKYRRARVLEAQVEISARRSFAPHLDELHAERPSVLDEPVRRYQHGSDLARRHGLPTPGAEELLLQVDDEKRDLRTVVDREGFPGRGSLTAAEREGQAARSERRSLQFHRTVR
jgi:hypothetical protein